jgi:hypothetical protein
VETAGLTPADVPELKERVRRMIVSARAELRESEEGGQGGDESS